MNWSILRPKQWKRELRFGTWNVRSLHKSGSLTTVVRELARYKLDLVGVQEVMWDKREWNFFYGKEMKVIIREQDYLYPPE